MMVVSMLVVIICGEAEIDWTQDLVELAILLKGKHKCYIQTSMERKRQYVYNIGVGK